MHSNCYNVPQIVPLLTVLALVALRCRFATICQDLPLWSLPRGKFFPRGWYARSPLPSWGRRCVLTTAGGRPFLRLRAEAAFPYLHSVTGSPVGT